MSEVLQNAKKIVSTYNDLVASVLIDATVSVADALGQIVSDTYHWRGLHPFNELANVTEVSSVFWEPLRAAVSGLHRRDDIHLAGVNCIDNGESIWVATMGHFVGLFDKPWLGIPPTQRMVNIRCVEFHRVANDRIEETAFFFDLIGVMRQAGQYPLPPQTGASFTYPGPKTHDGLLATPQSDEAGKNTLDVVHRMMDDLGQANEIAKATGSNRVPRELLAKTWHEDMVWYGPEGIGATMSIDRYQQQHQYPFRFNLSGKTFNGHVARFSEGSYAAYFGWPNLTNQPTGGFLGLPGGLNSADMRVVDVYRCDGDKLAENWVIIDLPHWLLMQGLDVLGRMRQLLGQEML